MTTNTVTVTTYLLASIRDGWENDNVVRMAQADRVSGPTLQVPAGSDLDICESAWTVGNRMEADAKGQGWAQLCRSMSVGDVIEFNGRKWLCQDFGWRQLSVSSVGYIGRRTVSREKADPDRSPWAPLGTFGVTDWDQPGSVEWS